MPNKYTVFYVEFLKININLKKKNHRYYIYPHFRYSQYVTGIIK